MTEICSLEAKILKFWDFRHWRHLGFVFRKNERVDPKIFDGNIIFLLEESQKNIMIPMSVGPGGGCTVGGAGPPTTAYRAFLCETDNIQVIGITIFMAKCTICL